jgi:hypothetical protein
MRLNLTVALAGLSVVLLAGCSSSTTSTPPPAQPSFVYYGTGFQSALLGAQIGAIAYPVSATSALAFTIDNSPTNGLLQSGPMAVDTSGRIFVLNNNADPVTIGVFATPLSTSSMPSFTLTLPAGLSTDVYDLIFDGAGNLWVSNANSNTIFEFNGPFTSTATLAANFSFGTALCSRPEGLGFDLAGNLYSACENNSGANAVAVFLKGAGFSNATTVDHYLTGPGRPVALIFDRSGNLYVGSNLASPSGGIAMYLGSNLASGATPNVYDSTGMGASFSPYQFAFDPAGNLYDGDCSGSPTAHLYVYPTGSQALSTTLAPTASYSDANILASGCVFGVAVH